MLLYLDFPDLLDLGERLFLAEDPTYARFALDLRTLGAAAIAVSCTPAQMSTDARVGGRRARDARRWRRRRSISRADRCSRPPDGACRPSTRPEALRSRARPQARDRGIRTRHGQDDRARRERAPVHLRVGDRGPPGQDVRPDLRRRPRRRDARTTPTGRVACETLVNTGLVVVSGEIPTETYVDIPEIVRETINEIGYNDGHMGFDGNSCAVLTAIDEQSAGHRPGRRHRLRDPDRSNRRGRARSSTAPAIRG